MVRFDLSRQTALIEEPKNGRRRSVILVDQIVALLEILLERDFAESEYLFPGRSNLKPINISSAWQRAVKSAGLKDFRFHDLRHTAGSYLAMEGASVIVLGEAIELPDLINDRCSQLFFQRLYAGGYNHGAVPEKPDPCIIIEALDTPFTKLMIELPNRQGTGKSTLLLNMIKQDAEQNRGFCLIDPHGDLAEQVSEIAGPNQIYWNVAGCALSGHPTIRWKC